MHLFYKTRSIFTLIFIERIPLQLKILQLFLRNTTDHYPYPLTLPGCETVCPLDQFTELADPVVPKDWEQSCVVYEDPNYTPPSAAPP
jgi:hypothetical protein